MPQAAPRNSLAAPTALGTIPPPIDCPAMSPLATGAPHPQPPPLQPTEWVKFGGGLNVR